MIDVFYLTYYKDFSQENYNRIKKLAGEGQRVINVSDIEGIYNAHAECASRSHTENFYVIDGDAWLVDEFDLTYTPSKDIDVYPGVPQPQCTHVWRALNPATGELAGYGGVKIFNRNAFYESDETIVDVTTETAKRGFPYYRIDIPSCETRFANTPFNAFKGAFRECCKLASGVATDDIQKRLDLWRKPKYIKYRDLISIGAKLGFKYGTEHRDNRKELEKINDWKFLEKQFEDID